MNSSFPNLWIRAGKQTTLAADGNRQLLINRKRNLSPKKFPLPISSPEEPAWVIEARDDPDPRVRLSAIEAWAQNPGENLDPITYALVEPDESMRTCAQELLEEALARR